MLARMRWDWVMGLGVWGSCVGGIEFVDVLDDEANSFVFILGGRIF